MALTSGFFNSLNGDRPYNAQQMSDIFKGLITDGVYEAVGNKMAVQPNNGMTIQIATGRGWFGGHWLNNDAEYLQVVEAADVLLNRYCAVCVRVDEGEAVRAVTVYLKYSDFATTPVKPEMERTETVKEYCLAYIYIKAGASEITAGDIEDTRSNTELCGWVTGLIEQLDTTTLYSQWQALFFDWFDNLQDHINENTETMLVSALPVAITVVLDPSRWSADTSGYTQEVSITGMTATKSVIVTPNNTTVNEYAAAEIYAASQLSGKLVFRAVTAPAISIAVNVLHMGE